MKSLSEVISIHALLAESDPLTSRTETIFAISIHALLAESDNINSSVNTADQISIHALLAESDAVTIWPGYVYFDFYPRSPCGERLH